MLTGSGLPRCVGLLMSRKNNAGFEQLGEQLGKDWSAEIVPLRFITFVSLKKCQFFLGFHALSHHPQLKTSPHTDDRRRYCCLMGSSGDLTDERLVDLEGIHWELSKIAQT